MSGRPSATLEKASWLRRALRVHCPEGDHRVEYSSRSLMQECVRVDDRIAVKQRISSWFRPVSRFYVGSRSAEVVLSVWPWLTIHAFHLRIDGRVVYCDRRRDLFDGSGAAGEVPATNDDSADPLCPHCDRPLRGAGLDLAALPADLLRPDGPVGRPTAFFTFPRRQRLALIVAGILATLVGIISLAGAWLLPVGNAGAEMHGRHSAQILGFMMLVIGSAGFLYARRYRRLLAVTGSAGVVLIENDAVSSCRWRDIQAIRETQVAGDAQTVLPAAARGENHVFRVTGWDGVEMVFRSFLDDLPWLGEILRHETLPYLLPPALSDLEQGEVLDFGPLSIDAEGLRAGEDRRLRWHELQDVESANGALIVKQAGKWRAWFKAPLGQVPNAHVLLALIQHSRKGETRDDRGRMAGV